MIVKETFSKPETLDFDYEGIGNSQGKKIAGPIELSFIKLTVTGTASAIVKVYDADSAGPANYERLRLVMDAANTVPDFQEFSSPLRFMHGVYVVLEQGQNSGAVLCFASILP